jgi:hypothetical protein
MDSVLAATKCGIGPSPKALQKVEKIREYF